MVIEFPQSLGDLIEHSNHEFTCVVAHPHLNTDTDANTSGVKGVNAISTDRPVIAAIGPEGGFSDEEVEAAVQSGFAPLSMGPRILRVETAAIAISSSLIYADDK